MKTLSKLQIAAALALTTLSAFALDAAPKTVKVTGWVSDSQCGVDHASKGPNPSCVTKCIKEGAKPIFVDDAKSTVWTIDNPDAVKGPLWPSHPVHRDGRRNKERSAHHRCDHARRPGHAEIGQDGHGPQVAGCPRSRL